MISIGHPLQNLFANLLYKIFDWRGKLIRELKKWVIF